MEAMQEQSVDVVKRMKEITQIMQIPEHDLETQGVTPEEIEGFSFFFSFFMFKYSIFLLSFQCHILISYMGFGRFIG